MLPSGKKLKTARVILLIIVLSFTYNQVLPHHLILAKEPDIDYGRGPVEIIISSQLNTINKKEAIPQLTAKLPNNAKLPYYETWITATAYTSRPQETDASPFTAAWGDHVFWGMIASNSFPKGTKIQIPDYYGDKMFSVLDTMNQRYYHHIDIWMPDLDDARSWGTRYIKIRVYR